MSREVTVTTPPSRSPRAWKDEGEVLGVVPLVDFVLAGTANRHATYKTLAACPTKTVRSTNSAKTGDPSCTGDLCVAKDRDQAGLQGHARPGKRTVRVARPHRIHAVRRAAPARAAHTRCAAHTPARVLRCTHPPASRARVTRPPCLCLPAPVCGAAVQGPGALLRALRIVWTLCGHRTFTLVATLYQNLLILPCTRYLTWGDVWVDQYLGTRPHRTFETADPAGQGDAGAACVLEHGCEQPAQQQHGRTAATVHGNAARRGCAPDGRGAERHLLAAAAVLPGPAEPYGAACSRRAPQLPGWAGRT